VVTSVETYTERRFTVKGKIKRLMLPTANSRSSSEAWAAGLEQTQGSVAVLGRQGGGEVRGRPMLGLALVGTPLCMNRLLASRSKMPCTRIALG